MHKLPFFEGGVVKADKSFFLHAEKSNSLSSDFCRWGLLLTIEYYAIIIESINGLPHTASQIQDFLTTCPNPYSNIRHGSAIVSIHPYQYALFTY